MYLGQENIISILSIVNQVKRDKTGEAKNEAEVTKGQTTSEDLKETEKRRIRL